MIRRSLALFAFAILPAALTAQDRLTAAGKFTPATAKPGDEVTLEVAIEIEAGWHVYGKKDTNEPLKLTVTDACGLVAKGPIDFPDGEKHVTDGVAAYWVTGKPVLKVRYTVPADAKPGALLYRGALDYLACNETACEPPAKVTFDAKLVVGAAAPKQDGAIRTDATTMIVPAGSHELKELLDAAAAFLQWNILRSEAELNQSPNGGKFTLQSQMSLDKQSAEEVLSHLLYTKGYALLARDADKHLYEVVFMTGQRGREVSTATVQRTAAEILARPNLVMPVTTIVKLERINATIATNALRPFFAQNGAAGGTAGGITLGTAGTNNSLVLSGFQNQVADAIRMIQKVDADAPAEVAAPAAAPAPSPAAERLAALEKAVQALTEQIAGLRKQLADKK